MKLTLVTLGFFSTSLLLPAQSVQISVGLRETGFAGSTVGTIGANGGATGGIEFADRDVQTLTLDGSWQQFSFDLSTATITGFAGSSANSILEGTFGVLEHIRIQNPTGNECPLELWIDDVQNTITPVAGAPTTTTIADFEGFAAGTEVLFQEPGLSGSTAALIGGLDVSGVDDTVGFNSANSYRVAFSFLPDTVPPIAPSWCRLTSFGVTNTPNPVVRFDQSSVISFRMRGVTTDPASVVFSTSCPAGPHSFGGPALSFPNGNPTSGSMFDITATGLDPSQSVLYFVGAEGPAAPLSLIGVTVPNASFCMAVTAGIVTVGGANPLIMLPIDTANCGLALDFQAIQLDSTQSNLGTGMFNLGTSRVARITTGL